MVKKLISTLVLGFIVFHFYGQTPKLSLKEKTDWKEANDNLAIKDYNLAKTYYLEFYKKYPYWAELNCNLGICLFYLETDKQESKKYLEKAAHGGIPVSFYYLGRIHHYAYEFDKAKARYDKYIQSEGDKPIDNSEVLRLKEITTQAMAMVRYPKDVLIENLGEAVNTKDPEYVPLITSDESMLIFTSRRANSTGGKLDPYNKYFEDIYVSYNHNNTWTKAVPISPYINTDLHNACVGLSPEGNILIIFNTDKTLVSGDLYWSEFDGKTWSKPIKYDESINSSSVESSAAFAPDGKTIYFSSDRPGGFGGKDLYRTIKFPDGTWSLPANLGNTINTMYDDDAPFVHPNGATLYFSSKGHNTMGDYDIFASELDTGGVWSAPENVGYPINTTYDDVFFSVSADGKTGYYSSIRSDGYGDQDLYKIKLNKNENPVVKGKILNVEGLVPIKATLTLEDASKKERYGIYKTNAKTGNYLLMMNYEKKYRLKIEADGFETVEEEIVFKESDTYKEFYLKPVK